MSQPIEIKFKRGTSLALAALNPVLAAGEPCLETDTNKVKYGDGSTLWNDLPYATPEINSIDGTNLTPVPTGIPSGFNPSSISGLSMWFESADNQSGAISKGRLAQWFNKTKTNIALQNQETLRPKVVNLIKNKQVPSFDGVNDNLIGLTDLGQSLTAFVVLKTNGLNKNSSIIETDTIKLCSFDNNGRLGTTVGGNHYSSANNPVSASLVINCDDGILADTSINNYSLTSYGNVEIKNNGKFGSCLYFDGNSYIDAPAQIFGSGDFTIELWVKPTQAPTTSWNPIIVFGQGAGGQEIRLSQNINGNGNGAGIPNNDNNNYRMLSYGGNLPLDTWSHIALVRKGNRVNYYVNGEVKGYYLDVNFNFTNSGPCRIGYGFYPSDGYFKGYIDGIRVTKAAVYDGDYISLPSQAPGNFYSSQLVDNEPVLYSCEIDNGTLTSKINGLLDYSGPVTSFDNSNNFSIGSIFSGDIAAIVVYNRILTPVEYHTIKKYLHLRWVDEPGLLKNLMGYWPFDEVNGPRLDTSDNNNILAVGDAAGYSQDVLANNFSINDYNVSYTNINIGGSAPYSIAYGAGIYVATTTGTTYYTSSDGSTWTSRSLPLSKTWNTINYVNNRFIIVGDSEIALTSTNGIDWNQVTIENLLPYNINPSLMLNFNGNNGDNSTSDSSTNNFTVTLNGGAQISSNQSKFGNTSLYLDRNSSSYATVECTSLDNELLTSDFTMECWFYATSDGGTSCLMSNRHYDSTHPNWGKIYCIAASRPYGDTWRNPVIWCGGWDSWWRGSIQGPAFQLNTWYHVAMTKSYQTGIMKLYVDGVLVGSTGGFNLDDWRPMNDLLIGRRWDTWDGNNAYFDGYIDDAKIVKGIIYTDNFTPGGESYGTDSYGVMPANKNWRSVSYGNNKFVAVSYSDKFAYSSDGNNWSATTITSSQNWHNVLYGNNKFLAYTNNSQSKATSTDGINWNVSLSAGPTIRDMTYHNNKFLAVAVNQIQSSTDGINWSGNLLSVTDNSRLAIINNKFAVLNYDLKTLFLSEDGISWKNKKLIKSIDDGSYVRLLSSDNNSLVAIKFGSGYKININNLTINQTSLLLDGLGYLETSIVTPVKSFAVWVKIPNNTNRSIMEVLGQWDGANGSWRLLHDTDNGGLLVDISQNRVLSNTNIADNKWHFVVGIYDNNNYKIYVDGVLKVSSSVALTGLLSGYNLRVASLSLSPTSSLIGELDNLGLWDRALTSAEINQMYNDGIGLGNIIPT